MLMYTFLMLVVWAFGFSVSFEIIFFCLFWAYILVSFSSTIVVLSSFGLDTLSFLLMGLTLWSGLMLFLVVLKYKKNFYSFFKFKMLKSLLFFFLTLTFFFFNFFYFFIFFELSLLPLMLMIIFWGYQVERMQATFYLFIYTMVGSLPLLLILIYLMTAITKSFNWLFFSWLAESSFFFFFLMFFFFFSFFIKFPIYFFHLWLPKAHVEAPVSGSMVLAAVLLKMGGYGLLRGVVFWFFFKSGFLFFGAFCLWGAVLSSFICMMQSDMKSLIAFSSISHMGVLAFLLFFFSSLSMSGVIMILLGHGFCSSMLFYSVNFHYERSFSRQMYLNRGSFNHFFYFSLIWFIFLAINLGAPPFLNLIGELIVFMISIKSWVLSFLMGVSSFLVAYYCIYLYSIVVHGHIFKNFVLLFEMELIFLLGMLHFFPLLSLIFKLSVF